MKKKLISIGIIVLLFATVLTVEASSHLQSGYQFLNEGNWRRAIEEFEQGLASSGYDLDLADGLVQAYVESTTSVQDYVQSYEAKTVEDYFNPINHYILGRLRLKAAEEDRYYFRPAVESFSIALAFGLEEARTYYYLGNAYDADNTWGLFYNHHYIESQLEEYEKSILNYERSIELDPTFLDSYFNLAVIYLVTGNIDRSLRILETAMIAIPEDPLLIYWYAHFSYIAGNYEDSISNALHATHIFPQFPHAYGLLGLAYDKLGEQNMAIAMLRQGFNLGLDNEWEYYRFDYRSTLSRLTD